uniref:Uncharacterized protein n=1 Tax=Burkholderia sp. (strain CCGE1003) TaxID=640512 RepID=E1T7E9_BURSG
MASRMIHDKIPHNVRVNNAAADEAMLRAMYKSAARAQRSKTADAVAPSVVGLKGITPSTKGIAAKARFARLAKVAKATADGLNAIETIRNSEQAASNPELAALVNDPRFLATIQKVVAKIAKEVNELTTVNSDEPKATVSPLTSHRMSQEERVLHAQRLAASQLGAADSGPVITAEDMERVARARAKLSRLKTAEVLGDAGDIVRAQFGQEPRAYDGDDMCRLMDKLEGKFK